MYGDIFIGSFLQISIFLLYWLKKVQQNDEMVLKKISFGTFSSG